MAFLILLAAVPAARLGWRRSRHCGLVLGLGADRYRDLAGRPAAPRMAAQHAIWRLRNRLLVTYLFIAAVPILLIAVLRRLRAGMRWCDSWPCFW